MKKILSVLIICGLLIPNILFAQTETKAYLTIKVNVNGVEIKINNKSYGFASTEEPIIVELEKGNYKITASKKDYKTDNKDIILKSGESRQITFQLDKPEDFEVDKEKDLGIIGIEYGDLIVVVKKADKLVPAKVYVDDKYADNAPVTINKLTVGEHNIYVSYKELDKRKTIIIEKNKKLHLEIELTSFSNVNFQSNINGVSASFDNQVITIPKEQKIEQGKYDFIFDKPGYEKTMSSLSFDNDRNYRVDVNLKPTFKKLTYSDVGRPYKSGESKKVKKWDWSLGIEGPLGGIMIGVLGGMLLSLPFISGADDESIDAIMWGGSAVGGIAGMIIVGNLTADIEYDRSSYDDASYYNNRTNQIIENKMKEIREDYYKESIKIHEE